MDRKKLLARITGGGGLLAVLTLATSGLFKVAAFAREAFIASHFGLSSFTDAYFAFQQFPLILLTFMFGAFGLAFTPAYVGGEAFTRECCLVAWLAAVWEFVRSPAHNDDCSTCPLVVARVHEHAFHPWRGNSSDSELCLHADYLARDLSRLRRWQVGTTCGPCSSPACLIW